MVDDVNRAPTAAPTEAAGPASSGIKRSRLVETILVFVPAPLRQVIEKGLLQTLAWLFLAVVVLPPLIALLAAFWLVQLGKFESPSIKHLRGEYLAVIQEGFSIEEVAARSNARLDYLQWFDYELKPSDRRPKRIAIDLVPYQKATIDIKEVKLVADTADCSLPETEDELVVVAVDGVKVVTLPEEMQESHPIDARFWKRYSDEPIEQAVTNRTLSFALTPAASKFDCSKVRISGGIRVFKDVLPSTNDGTAP
jgi:hypothetical protein